MTETMANGYSYDSARLDLFNEYQHDRVKMIIKIFVFFCTLDKSNLRSRMVRVPFKRAAMMLYQDCLADHIFQSG